MGNTIITYAIVGWFFGMKFLVGGAIANLEPNCETNEITGRCVVERVK